MDRRLLAASLVSGALLPFSRRLSSRVTGKEDGRAARRRLALIGAVGVSSCFYMGSRLEYLNILKGKKVPSYSLGNLFYLVGVNSTGILAGLSVLHSSRLLTTLSAKAIGACANYPG